MIAIKGTKSVNEKWQFVYITIAEHQHTISTPVLVGKELQTYIDSNNDKYLFEIGKREYPGAILEPQENETELQAMERWIKEGHTNSAIMKGGEEIKPAKVIKKKSWKSTHPKTIELSARIDVLSSISDELKEILKELL